MRVAVFGAGYVGLVTGACLAELGHDVVVRDVIEAKVDSTSENWLAPASTDLEPSSVAITVAFAALRISSIRPRISRAEPPTRSAKRRISSATTAKRLPVSPAPAASMVALIDRMFV